MKKFLSKTITNIGGIILVLLMLCFMLNQCVRIGDKNGSDGIIYYHLTK